MPSVSMEIYMYKSIDTVVTCIINVATRNSLFAIIVQMFYSLCMIVCSIFLIKISHRIIIIYRIGGFPTDVFEFIIPVL